MQNFNHRVECKRAPSAIPQSFYEGKFETLNLKEVKDLRIGLLSPNTRRTRIASSTKNATKQTKGNNWYRTYNPIFRCGSLVLGSKWPVQLKAVSRAIYPVPMNRMSDDTSRSPMEMAVPSSSSWKPTIEFNNKIHVVAVIAARWTAVKPY